jgi:hypothetical protein
MMTAGRWETHQHASELSKTLAEPDLMGGGRREEEEAVERREN